VKCYHCGSEKVHKHGKTSNGKQRFKCRSCGRSLRENPQGNGYDEERKEEILRAYHERASLRDLTRVFGVSRNTVSSWLKKSHSSAASGSNAIESPKRRRAGTR
jgi:transposase-like protein